MTSWGASVRALAVGAALLGACASDGEPDAGTTTTASSSTSEPTTTSGPPPERPASTTTTAYDPAAVEGQVEAAYLRSWDVYADAVYNLELDEQALEAVYADPLLSVVRDEVAGRIADRRAASVRVEHDYTIEMTGQETAAVIDSYLNHQVLVDPDTKEPIEPDPNQLLTDVFTLRTVEGRWVVFDQQRIR